jgi:hypothetical protein
MTAPKPFYAPERRTAGIADGYAIYGELSRLYDFARTDVLCDDDGHVVGVRSAAYVHVISRLLRQAAELLKLNDHEERLRELEALMGKTKPAARKPTPGYFSEANGRDH